ncbi:copper radical oxidase [Dendrothele bispora CBS 962.96]|uniref:Copper radical oxidase n=1 Tax=Dendrothele bispora (strain CBS 962.96) TaxID=1314807 RepID=A0A4S8L7Z6_DENBC|nr:copper radical oxidase [Dendrothele bispora CBS 962.96]
MAASRLYSLIYSLLVLSVIRFSAATDPAWNGYTPSGSTTVTAFTPYWPAPGTISIDSKSPSIRYSGYWNELSSLKYVNGSSHSTSDTSASFSFSFVGDGIEWYGSSDRHHGPARVFIDGKLVETLDTKINSATPQVQQRLYAQYGLPQGEHTLKIENAKSTIDVDVLVVLGSSAASRSLPVFSENSIARRSSSSTQFTLHQKGNTGVAAMQLVVVSSTHALIVDKVEHNPLTIDGHPAWAALFNLKTGDLTPLQMKSNSFCAGGSFLSNGTLINVGGNPVVEDETNAADFGDEDGLQAVRLFHPCDENQSKCKIYESPSRIRMASPRWYPTVLRIEDGSAMIIGGAKKGGWINNATVNNPTIEYYPPKAIHGSNGLPIHLPFMVDTLNSNLFPIAISLPDGKVFVAANRDAMIYDWKTNTERRLPRIPNGVRVTYPMAGTGTLLPLTPDNDYTPEVMLCGGSTIDETRAGYDISSQEPASSQCSRLVLTDEGISKGWQVEQMPEPRVMPDMVLLPTGHIVVVNGAGSGISGYGNVKDQVGSCNSDNPVFTPAFYDPTAPAGQRFSSEDMPTSDIPRMYHSVASLTPEGDVIIAGSNPNLDRSEERYGTEYRVERLRPPYMGALRPELSVESTKIGFGEKFYLKTKTSKRQDVKVALMDLGFVTHANHANQRLVYLPFTTDDRGRIYASGPPNGGVYPPGPGWLYVIVDGVPSKGIKVIIGDGSGPKVDHDAINNILKHADAEKHA